MTTKLTLTIEQHIIEKAKVYAKSKGVAFLILLKIT